MKKILLPFLCAILFSGTAYQASAGDITSDDKGKAVATPEPLPAFRAGAWEVELRGGAMFSFLNQGAERPTMNYALEDIRVGYMLTDVKYDGIFRGNVELLGEGLVGQIFEGPGSYIAGGQLIFRYNFVQPGARLVPYFELGGGGLDNDVYKDQVQHRFGEAFEFVLHSGLGVRWMVTDRWGLSLEGDYRHISDAGLSSRNTGLNSVGATLGVNWLF